MRSLLVAVISGLAIPSLAIASPPPAADTAKAVEAVKLYLKTIKAKDAKKFVQTVALPYEQTGDLLDEDTCDTHKFAGAAELSKATACLFASKFLVREIPDDWTKPDAAGLKVVTAKKLPAPLKKFKKNVATLGPGYTLVAIDLTGDMHIEMLAAVHDNGSNGQGVALLAATFSEGGE
jgi:hypothetical protein